MSGGGSERLPLPPYLGSVTEQGIMPSNKKSIFFIVGGAVFVAALGGFYVAGLIEVDQILIGFGLLLGGAELLVRGAVTLSRRVGVSSLVVGLTVVAFGTSAPELAAGISAVLQDKSELNIGNVVGSNIANIGLILGLTAIIYPITCKSGFIKREIPQMIGVSFVALAVMFDGVVSRFEGVFLIVLLGGFLFLGFRAGRVQTEADTAAQEELSEEFGLGVLKRYEGWALDIALIVAGLGALVLGANVLVTGATSIAMSFGVSEVVIGLTIVAFGTSSPELATCVVAAARREPDIALGNVIGSNIFNVLCVLGITSLIRPLDVPVRTLGIDIWIMLGFALVFLPLTLTGRKISRIEGGVLFAAYLGYMVYLIVLALRG